MRQRSDAELLDRADDDPRAFGQFYRRHERAVVAFAGRMVRDPDTTVDAVAETFARAFESRHRFDRSNESARGWLLGIARHVVLAGWRRGRLDRDARERLGMDVIAVSNATIHAVEAAVLESVAAVEEAWLADLPPDQREAVRRRVLEGADYGDLASELECSQAVLRQRVSRGLSHLRQASLEEQ